MAPGPHEESERWIAPTCGRGVREAGRPPPACVRRPYRWLSAYLRVRPTSSSSATNRGLEPRSVGTRRRFSIALGETAPSCSRSDRRRSRTGCGWIMESGTFGSRRMVNGSCTASSTDSATPSNTQIEQTALRPAAHLGYRWAAKGSAASKPGSGLELMRNALRERAGADSGRCSDALLRRLPRCPPPG